MLKYVARMLTVLYGGYMLTVLCGAIDDSTKMWLESKYFLYGWAAVDPQPPSRTNKVLDPLPHLGDQINY